LKGGGFNWIESDLDEWESDPEDPLSDVSVCYVGIGNNIDVSFFPLEYAATGRLVEDLGIGIGDEVFLAGLFPSARQLVRRFGDQAACRTGSGNSRSGNART
jgi:hypothetical protein